MDIFVRGFFHVNLGDDLFLYMLARRYPTHRFHVILNEEYGNIFNSEANIVVHPYKKIRRALDRFLSHQNKDFYSNLEKKCQLNVVIGGSLFQEGLDDSMVRERLAKMPISNPTYILGANFGPYVTEDYRTLVEAYLARTEDVCFRDQWSRDKFANLKQVRFAPDIVLGIETILSEKVLQKKQVFVSLIDCLKKSQEIQNLATEYDDFILRCINYYSQNGYEIILSSFCKMEGDEEAIDRILKQIPNQLGSSVKVLNYQGENWREIVHAIQESEKIIASRFHSMILGMVFGGEVLPIAYNKKFVTFLDNFSLGKVCLSIDRLSGQNVEDLNYLTFQDREAVAQEAAAHFIKLDEQLTRGSDESHDN